MSPKLLYRIAAVALVLFAAGHTMGFLTFRPASSEAVAVLAAMRNVHFDFNGAPRTYSDFYTGFGLMVTVYLLFCGLLAWHLGGLAARRPEAIGWLAWIFAAAQLACLVLCIQYFFIVPTVFSAVIVVCLLGAAWRLRQRPSSHSI